MGYGVCSCTQYEPRCSNVYCLGQPGPLPPLRPAETLPVEGVTAAFGRSIQDHQHRVEAAASVILTEQANVFQKIADHPLAQRDATYPYTPIGTDGALHPGAFITGLAPAMPGDAGSLLPTDKQARKDLPVTTGVLDYFPLAIAEIARVSKAGNDQHNPGEPLHWSRHKSTDQADCIGRHLLERGKVDSDGQRHSAKLAWRSLALLQLELEAAELEGK